MPPPDLVPCCTGVAEARKHGLTARNRSYRISACKVNGAVKMGNETEQGRTSDNSADSRFAIRRSPVRSRRGPPTYEDGQSLG
jgi:hypothetical protein